MSKRYTIGKFAKMAGVTEKTLRHYDKIGLVLPQKEAGNGYRLYSDENLIQLQKILFLKLLGFNLSDIAVIMSSSQDLRASFSLQRNLIRKRIDSLQILEDSLSRVIRHIDSDSWSWNEVADLIQLINLENETSSNYKDSRELDIRIQLHDRFSTNPEKWFDWLAHQMRFHGHYRILEIGCGNGRLWESIDHSIIRNREVFLLDQSSGMIDVVRHKLGKDFNCIVGNCESLPFKSGFFDMVIANHVLFYLQDLEKGLSEIERVLKSEGEFYCTTYSEKHMREVTELCIGFDPNITLSSIDLFRRFGMEDGEEILHRYFSHVKGKVYNDQLIVNDGEALIEYILSCHGNQSELIIPRIQEFRDYINKQIEYHGYIAIQKQACLFICKK